MEETEDTRIYKVVVNHEEQYSIWSADREPPLGWRRSWEKRSEGGVSGIHQGSLDRHAALELAKKDGRGGAQNLALIRAYNQ